MGGCDRFVHSNVRTPGCRMSSLANAVTGLLLMLCCTLGINRALAEGEDENRPYEFSFNIVDFQHRYEKKDADGIVTGEYGFITADGVYHETAYATDKNGDFVITRMRNRKITSLKDAQEVFKDRPEAAKKLVEAVARACSGCKIPIKTIARQTTPSIPTTTKSPPSKKVGSILKQMAKTLTDAKRTDGKNEIPRGAKSLRLDDKEEVVRSMVDSAKKLLREGKGLTVDSEVMNDGVLEKMANELYYRFNYTITSHGHHEDGYRSGKKDGGYRAQSENGVDTQVRYLSNEFGHQPNVTFVRQSNETEEEQGLKGYSFLWYWL